MTIEQCDTVDGVGVRCGLPAGHAGWHAPAVDDGSRPMDTRAILAIVATLAAGLVLLALVMD